MGLSFLGIWKNKDKILEGIRNNTFPPKKLRRLIASTSWTRLTICYECPNMSENAKKHFNYKTSRLDKHCTLCGCNIKLKTSSLSSSCPDNPPRWEAVVSEEQSANIQQYFQDEEQSSSQEH